MPTSPLAIKPITPAFAALDQYDADWVADDDAGVKYRLNQRGTDYYGILRESVGVPAALAELAFLSNPAEEALLASDTLIFVINDFLRDSRSG